MGDLTPEQRRAIRKMRRTALDFEEAMDQVGEACKRSSDTLRRFVMLATPAEYEAERAAYQHMGEVPPSLEVYRAEHPRRQ